ncbi:MAG: rRNA maturation RNase YbeY [Micropepsaceae bacterium]
MPKVKLEVDIQVQHAAWRKAWPRASSDIKVLIDVASNAVKFPSRLKAAEVSVVLASDSRLRSLNSQFRGRDKPTNVLSFPDEAVPLGGLALAFQTVQREAKIQQKLFVNHSKHMILHGFLHLLGHDHIRPRDARLMEQLEIAILSELGISNPYEFED